MSKNSKTLIVSHRDPQGLEIIRECESALNGVKFTPYQAQYVVHRARELKQGVTLLLFKLSHRIDCNALPISPDGFTVHEHKKAGYFFWNPMRVKLYRSPSQFRDKFTGINLRRTLTDKPVMNACVLDYLLQNPQLIPRSWEDECGVFFWGTIYRCVDDEELYVRCLVHCIDHWKSEEMPIFESFDESDVAAIHVV